MLIQLELRVDALIELHLTRDRDPVSNMESLQRIPRPCLWEVVVADLLTFRGFSTRINDLWRPPIHSVAYDVDSGHLEVDGRLIVLI